MHHIRSTQAFALILSGLACADPSLESAAKAESPAEASEALRTFVNAADPHDLRALAPWHVEGLQLDLSGVAGVTKSSWDWTLKQFAAPEGKAFLQRIGTHVRPWLERHDLQLSAATAQGYVALQLARFAWIGAMPNAADEAEMAAGLRTGGQLALRLGAFRNAVSSRLSQRRSWPESTWSAPGSRTLKEPTHQLLELGVALTQAQVAALGKLTAQMSFATLFPRTDIRQGHQSPRLYWRLPLAVMSLAEASRCEALGTRALAWLAEQPPHAIQFRFRLLDALYAARSRESSPPDWSEAFPERDALLTWDFRCVQVPLGELTKSGAKIPAAGLTFASYPEQGIAAPMHRLVGALSNQADEPLAPASLDGT